MKTAVRVCRLDGRQRSKRAVLARLAQTLGFPTHFGNNLDALNDVLAIDSAGPIQIEWRVTKSAQTSIGADFKRLVSTLENVASERSDMEFHLTYTEK